MGISHSTARYIAPASFLYDFAIQQYGMLSKPNMKDIHDANLSFFSPQPYFIALFFFPQQIAQLVFLWKLWKKDGTEREIKEMTDYTPVYALGNFCIGSRFSISSCALVLPDSCTCHAITSSPPSFSFTLRECRSAVCITGVFFE